MTVPGKYRLVVTSGPTREWLDPVRFISNPSSGQTGWHIANEGLNRFHFGEVVYICGPVEEKYRSVPGAQNLAVETTAEMAQAVGEQVRDFLLLIMAAAPGDYQAAAPSNSKLKRSRNMKRCRGSSDSDTAGDAAGDTAGDDAGTMSIRLEPTIDILKSLIPAAAKRIHFYRVGFAAETDNIIFHGRQKLQEKQLDLICVNRVYRETTGFGDNRNSLYLLKKDQKERLLGPGSKKILAGQLLEHLIEQILPSSA